jgi:endonuclease/exonuclease/phosphatase family metal-dependent hydrolase
MPALRLMTFNVQMLPWAASTTRGHSNDAVQRAERVITALIAIPQEEQPDVICFNEVFDESGRDVLVEKLKPQWPHIEAKWSDGVLEDSGLMIVSRMPFLTLPTGDTRAERYYADSAGTDSPRAKGVGLVQIAVPLQPTTIVFTHLQSNSDAEDQYRDIRVKQLDTVHQLISDVLGPPGSAWANIIFVGDLNIRGDPQAVSDEWSSIFELHYSPLGAVIDDGWRTYMHPPGTAGDVDPGYTNRDLADINRKLQRLDYICVSKELAVDCGLVPHHIRTRLRQESDHWSTEAVLERKSANVTPSDAVEVLSLAPLPAMGPTWPTSVRVVPLEFSAEGSYQWAYVKTAGTYTIHHTTDAFVQLYAEDDLSEPLPTLDTLSLLELSREIRAAFGERTGNLDPRGKTFAPRTPFFIAVRKKGRGSGLITVLEHHGDSPASAIWLSPHVEVKSGHPAGQRLGSTDECWFKARTQELYAGGTRDEVFHLHNPTHDRAVLTRHGTDLNPRDSVGGNQSDHDLKHNTAGGEVVLLGLTRVSHQAAGFTLLWDSPVTYVHLAQPIGLHIGDRTGIDWLGDGKAKLRILVDADPLALFDGLWDDADTGEEWPALAQAIRSAVQDRTEQDRNLAFTESIDLLYFESDPGVAGAEQIRRVFPLDKSQEDLTRRCVALPVPDTTSGGQYTFFCTLARYPS